MNDLYSLESYLTDEANIELFQNNLIGGEWHVKPTQLAR